MALTLCHINTDEVNQAPRGEPGETGSTWRRNEPVGHGETPSLSWRISRCEVTRRTSLLALGCRHPRWPVFAMIDGAANGIRTVLRTAELRLIVGHQIVDLEDFFQIQKTRPDRSVGRNDRAWRETDEERNLFVRFQF